MKRIVFMMMLVMSMSLCSCISTRDSVNINKVEVGMNKTEIQSLLGKPLFKNANEIGEEWGYRKVVGEIIDAEEMLFIVTFDNNERVVAYRSVKEFPRFLNR